jgi:NAD(P)-dependent dehydrogenase (short-subunit alcohol dehydrogenase family)
MDLQLHGKRALVTGGSRGIGRAVARQLALEGAEVVVASRDIKPLDMTAREIAKEAGRRVEAIAVDTSDDESVKRLVAEAVKLLGGVDILVNGAAKPGGQYGSPKFADATDQLLLDEFNVKVLGYLRMAREVAPHMIANKWGRIINISGLAARFTGSIVGTIRNVSVVALTKNLADELGPKGINVTVIHPGYTRTERTLGQFEAIKASSGATEEQIERNFSANVSIGRIVDATEVADVVAFLASPRSVSINGDVVACGGGHRGEIHY